MSGNQQRRPEVEGSLAGRVTARAAAKDARRAQRAADREARKVIGLWERTFGPPPANRRGGFGPAAGRLGHTMRLPPLVTTSAQLCSVYPFVADPGLGVDGPLIGLDVYTRTSFQFAVHELYRAGLVTSPNVVVTGEIGSGKSSLLKCIAGRGIPFGVFFNIVDIKGEYDELADFAGITPVRIGPGLGTILNPLQAIRRDPELGDEQFRQLQRSRRLLLLEGLLEIQLGTPLTEAERSLIEYAVDAVTRTNDATTDTRLPVPTLSTVLHTMGTPDVWAHRLSRVDYPLDQFVTDSRRVRLALERMISGALGGVFDGEASTGIQLDFAQPGAILDLRAIRSSDQMAAMAMTCAQSWLEAELTRPDSPPRVSIYDEFALIAGSLPLVRRMREQFKLARALGTANILGFHRFDSLAASGPSGSEQVRITRELVEDCGIRVSYRQSAGSLDAAQEFLGTNGVQTQLLRHLRQGVGLWKIGTRPFVIKHQLSRRETAMVNTDSRMLTLPEAAELTDAEFDDRLATAMGVTP